MFQCGRELTGDQEKFSKVRVLFVFKYDLGGPVDELETAESLLKPHFPEVTPDESSLLEFNLSYLSIRDPVMTLERSQIQLVLESQQFSFVQTVKLYPSSGLLTFILETNLSDVSSSELVDFYASFYREKNKDYLPYIKSKGKNTRALKLPLQEIPEKQEAQLHFSEIVDKVTGILGPLLKKNRRPYVYNFHDVRTIFAVNGEYREDDVLRNADNLYKLVSLNKQATNCTKEVASLLEKSPIKLQNKHALNGSWACVFLFNGDTELEDKAVLAFDIIHSYWYMCQCWIFILDYLTSDKRESSDEKTLLDTIELVRRQDHDRTELSEIQLSVSERLREVKNMDIMLKDPQLSRIAKSFYDSLGIDAHIRLVDDALSLLDKRYQLRFESLSQRITSITQRQTKMIEVFIAISAAAGIGALVANTYGLSLTFVVLTWVVVLAISIVYVLYFLFYGRLRRIWGAFQRSKGEGTDSPSLGP